MGDLLDKGERGAIPMARLENLPLLIEEKAGREVARKLGVRISGIAGQVLMAVRENLISKAEGEQKLPDLRMARRINASIQEAVE